MPVFATGEFGCREESLATPPEGLVGRLSRRSRDPRADHTGRDLTGRLSGLPPSYSTWRLKALAATCSTPMSRWFTSGDPTR